MSLTPTRGLVSRAMAAGVPLVLVDAEHPKLPSVAVDHAAAATSAVDHLFKLGHRHIALVDHAEDPFAPVYPDERHRGYRRALAEAGLPERPEYERVTDFSPEAGAAAMRELLALDEPPTAIFVGSDTQALGILEGARRAGLRVPDYLAVVGYTTSKWPPIWA